MEPEFSPVPAEDRERGRNHHCYEAGQLLTQAIQERFMEEIKPICIEMEREYGVPAALLGGQAVNESGFGRTRTGYFANNLCGLKFVAAWGRQPPAIMDGKDFGVETYQLVGQPDEAEGQVKIVENLGENRLIFDEASRFDNRYFKFGTKREFFDFLCRITYLNGSEGTLYPKDLRPIFAEYRQNLQAGMTIREACSLAARRLGEAEYCHVEAEEGGSPAERRGNYYSKVITQAMDQWNTYEWTEIALST